MKYAILSFFLILTYSYSFAQLNSAKLAGQWQATCLLEQEDDSELSFCKICPVELSSKGEKLTLASVIFNFNNEKLTILSREGNSTIDIQYNTSTQHLTFELNGDKYDFTVMIIDAANKIVLKNMDGHLVYLERKNLQPGN